MHSHGNPNGEMHIAGMQFGRARSQPAMTFREMLKAKSGAGHGAAFRSLGGKQKGLTA